MKLNLNNCIDISCAPENLVKTGKILPQTYFLCDENSFDSFEDAVCELPNNNHQQWFDGLKLKTVLFDICNNTQNGDYMSNYDFSQKTSPNGSVCCVSNNSIDLLQETSCNSHMECATPAQTSFTKEEEEFGLAIGKIMAVICLVIGLTAVFGNLVVMINSSRTLLKKGLKRITERQIYKVLILHLSCADCAMGLYVTVLTINSFNFFSEYKYGNEGSKKEGSTLCIFLGLINFASSQISVTAITTITGLRLFSIIFPYRKVRFKIILFIVTFTWIFWIVVACLPVIDNNYIKTIFSAEVRIKVEENKFILLRYSHFRFLIETILNKINFHCNFSNHRKYSLDSHPTWNVLIDISKKLKLLNIDQNSDITYLGYYNNFWVCTMQFFVGRENPSSFFTLPVVLYNVISFSFIFVSQFIIACKTSKYGQQALANDSFYLNCFKCSLSNSSRPNSSQQRRESENKKMHRRMFYIVMTDFICWIPLSIFTLHFFVKSIYSSTCDYLSYKRSVEYWMPGVVIFVLPLNSVINPFIYSFRFWKPLQKLCKVYSTKIPKSDQISKPPVNRTQRNTFETISTKVGAGII